MAKHALIILAALTTGGVATLGVVSAPNALKAYRNAHQVAFAAQRTVSAGQGMLGTQPHSAVLVLEPVNVVGDPNSTFRKALVEPIAALRPKAAPPTAELVPCDPAWQSLHSGPGERHYRELCAGELNGAAANSTAPDRPAVQKQQREKLAAPPHMALGERLADPQADVENRPPLVIGE